MTDMDFDIGSNFYRNAEGRIDIDGLSQLAFDYNKRYNELMLKGMIFDQHGTLAARISENTLALNIRGSFEITSEGPMIRLLDRETQNVLLELKFIDTNKIQLHKAKLYTGRGRPFEVTPTMWRLGDKTHSGESVDCAGKPVELT
jgi:hypothetical protein